MAKKRLTQRFPFLLPLRRAQRKFFFYGKMRFGGDRYAKARLSTPLPYCVYASSTRLINENTGFDLRYQENKVFNLRLASQPVNMVLIQPRETFSFWQLVRHAEKTGHYKEGLAVIDGELCTVEGGGLCHLSNFLYFLFLHTPLTIVERHAHRTKDFPSPDSEEPDGVDATVVEGWADLKMRNLTGSTFQIELRFEGDALYGRVLSDQPCSYRYAITNRDKQYFKESGSLMERVSVIRQTLEAKTNTIVSECVLYTDNIEIGSPLKEKILSEKELTIWNA